MDALIVMSVFFFALFLVTFLIYMIDEGGWEKFCGFLRKVCDRLWWTLSPLHPCYCFETQKKSR